jgi:hypothetical protein
LSDRPQGYGPDGLRDSIAGDTWGRTLSSLRLLRIALVSSLVLNVLLVTAFWLYIHYAGTLSLIQDAVGFFE